MLKQQTNFCCKQLNSSEDSHVGRIWTLAETLNTAIHLFTWHSCVGMMNWPYLVEKGSVVQKILLDSQHLRPQNQTCISYQSIKFITLGYEYSRWESFLGWSTNELLFRYGGLLLTLLPSLPKSQEKVGFDEEERDRKRHGIAYMRQSSETDSHGNQQTGYLIPRNQSNVQRTCTKCTRNLYLSTELQQQSNKCTRNLYQLYQEDVPKNRTSTTIKLQGTCTNSTRNLYLKT